MRKLIPLLILAFAVVPAGRAQAQGDLLARINQLRASLSLPPYNTNPALSSAAQQHAQWMVANGEVSHTQENGSTPRTRAAAAGYGSQWVSENIYGGSNASVDTAWNFWINSAIHYRGLTSPNYQEVGVGIASGEWGGAYVLVFGGAAAPVQIAPAASAASGGNGGSNAVAAPPSFVVGVDTFGNIMHEIQAGDTLGDIALLYGYTWDEIPAMLTLNELDETASRELQVGAVFLVPPYAGTYTPTPGGPPPTDTPSDADANPAVGIVTSTPAPTDSGVRLDIVTSTPTVSPSPTMNPAPFAADSTDVPTPAYTPDAATPLVVADAAPVLRAASTGTTRSEAGSGWFHGGRSPWLLGAVALQMVFILGAGAELVLKRLRR